MQGRLSYRPAFVVAASSLIASLIVVVCRSVQLFYQSDLDFWLDITNFAVVLLPFAFSILFAFVPDMRTRHIAWRTLVILIGVSFSWMLWKQQRLAADAAKRDQQYAVEAAVRQSNDHSDEQIAGVRKDVHSETQTLEEKMSALSGQVKASETDINGAIKRVVVPDPQYAKLQFSLFDSNATDFPLTTQTLVPDKDGVFTIDVLTRNVSETTAAKNGDIWVYVCDACIFAEEPQGFDRPKGLRETARHKLFQNLNPGVVLEKMTLRIKLNAPFSRFAIAFQYSCESCGKMQDPQRMTLLTSSLKINP